MHETSDTNPFVHYFKYGVAAAVTLFFGLTIYGSTAKVTEGSRGIKLTFGAAGAEPLDPGLHMKLPFFAEVIEVDVKEQKVEETAMASSSDEQKVQTSIAVNYRLRPEATIAVYSELGPDPATWEHKVFAPSVQETLKSVTARYTAHDLIAKRAEVKDAITDMLTERVNDGGYFTVIQVSITDFQFSKTYMDAIEAKQVAVQQEQQAEHDLARNLIDVKKIEQKATASAAAAVTRATGEAQALEIKAQAEANYHEVVTAALSEQSLRLREIEKWNGTTPLAVGAGGSLLLPGNGLSTPQSPR